MHEKLTRKQFFRRMASDAMQLSIDLMTPILGQQIRPFPAADSSLAADLTPEMLEQEAQRLGLDPSEPQQILKQLSMSLDRSGGSN